ncbi:MAG TPA: class I SAM-dependent methyltransferase [Flavobacteriaceae bacterium]|nr:class I SAM-dependent methyltransferase [Flavobacteriaceae bacterium]
MLHKDIQYFINENLNTDSVALVLKGSPFETVTIQELLEQIEAKSRCEKKLPTWFKAENIYYPNKLNIEQTSSEETASYKASLIEGNSLIDITGGFGVDCFYFAKHIKQVTHCELNAQLSELVTHNFNQLQANIETIAQDGLEVLKSASQTFDWVYVDPSRRHEQKGKVFFLKDCLPNVPEHLDFLFNKTANILIKTSPLLDISAGLNELKHVKTIHCVAVNNEMKELLWVLENDYHGAIAVKTVNLKAKGNEYFDFELEAESNIYPELSDPRSYLYEPNSAVMKSGGFNSICKVFGVKKLHPFSHLYTSESLIEDFPGRKFKVENVVDYNKKNLKHLTNSKANIATRNFPETVENIRKKHKIKDGGNSFIFFTTNSNGTKVVITCSKA